MLERLDALPEVEAVAIPSSVPLDIHGLPSRVITVEGHSRVDEGDDEALTNIVTPGCFNVMGIDLIAGRDFSPLLDVGAGKEAIVNEEFLKRYVAKGEPLGRQIRALMRNVRTLLAVVLLMTSARGAVGRSATPNCATRGAAAVSVSRSSRSEPMSSPSAHCASVSAKPRVSSP